jgi:plastocyanin
MAVLSVLAASLAHAEDITGTIIVKRKLTRQRVTASVSMYERGPAVELGKDSPEGDSKGDPLAFERSRVVVYIEGPGSPADRPITETISQTGRRFSPELVVIPVGSSVSFPNLDPIFHNVFSLSKPKSFDLGNYPKGETRIVSFNKPGIVYIDCHLHPNMAAAVVVTPNRWYARSDAAGQFALHGVPPGKYSVVAWHKTGGFVRKMVEVAPGKNVSVEFLVPLSEDAPASTVTSLPAAKLQATKSQGLQAGQ